MIVTILTACGSDGSAPQHVKPVSTAVLTPPSIATASTDAVVLTVGSGRFVIEVVDDSAGRAAGLSGREKLPPGTGMWFVFPGIGQPNFWMRGMQFPIDIVWVDAALRVVSVTHEAPAPPPGTTTEDLPLYGPGVPIMYALEINAGRARELKIEIGALVSFE